jgi:hypothetical protein
LKTRFKSVLAVFAKFVSLRLYVDGIGEGNEGVVDTQSGEASGNEEDGADADSKEEQAPKPSELDTYLGSKNVNPDQRPLKNFDRKAFSSKEEMDRFIEEAGAELIMSDEDIAAMSKAKKDAEAKKKPEEKETERDESGKFKKKDASEEVTDEEAIKGFYEKLAITEEEFIALPEKVQELLAESHTKEDDVSKKVTEVEGRYQELNTTVDTLKKDPVIAARLEELATGKQYIARELSQPSRDEISSLMEAATDEASFKQALAEFMVAKAEEVITVERSVIEKHAAKEKLENEAMAVVQEMIKTEKRIGITETDLKNIDDKHKEYDAWKGEKGLLKFFQKHRISLAQIKDIGAEKLLLLLAKDKGWDKERDSKIYQQGAKSLIAKIREAKDKARSIDMGKKSGLPNSDKSTGGYNRESLVADIASGTLTQWEKLLERADQVGDRKMMHDLNSIYDEAVRVRRQKQQPE